MILIDERIVFIHIPKNMGSFIEQLLMHNIKFTNIYSDLVTFQKIYKNKYHNLYIHHGKSINKKFSGTIHHQCYEFYKNTIFNLKLKLSNFIFFCICRNPYTRIISLYKFTNMHLKKKISFDAFLFSGYFKNNEVFPHFSKLQIDFIGKHNNVTWLKFENTEPH